MGEVQLQVLTHEIFNTSMDTVTKGQNRMESPTAI